MSSKFPGTVDEVGKAVSVNTGVVNPPVDMFDKANPRSLLALLPERWQLGFEDAFRTHPHYFELHERDLYKLLRSEQKTPNEVVNTIRLKLWMEYERCQAGEGRRIEIFKVLGEVCRTNNFEKFVLARPERAAWLLCPPTSYRSKVEEALSYGIDRLRDILEMDIIEKKTDRSGNVRTTVNVKLGELQAKIVNMMDVRIHGAGRVKIDQTTRSVSLSLSHTTTSVGEAMEGVTADILDTQMKDLERRERAAMNLPIDSQEGIQDGILVDNALVDARDNLGVVDSVNGVSGQ